MTSTSTFSFVESSFSPSCSCRAVKIDVAFGSTIGGSGLAVCGRGSGVHVRSTCE
jgi:hypothetical protein